MITPVVTDLTDPRLVDFTGLTDVALRRKLETERGLYLAEGLKVIERSLAAGHVPRSFLVTAKHLPTLTRALLAAGYEERENNPVVFVVDEELIQTITGYRIHRGAMGAFNRPLLPTLSEFLRPTMRRIFILENLVDHTNVGAIFRSAAALGVDGVLITPSCADPLYRRSIKVAMGNVFKVPWTRLENWPQDLEILHEHGWITASLALEADALGLREFSALEAVRAADSKVAFVLGTEGDGLSKRTIAQTQYRVMIPMQAGVDSLNVAAAGALVAWELQ